MENLLGRDPPQNVDQFFRNFSGWTEPIHRDLDRNFRKFRLNAIARSRPWCHVMLRILDSRNTIP